MGVALDRDHELVRGSPRLNTYYYYTATYVGIRYTASTLLGGGTHGFHYGINFPYYYNVTSW